MLNAVRNPGKIASSGLASFRFARHYFGNLGWFLFLALLRCFSSGGSPHIPILFSIWYTSYTCMDCSIRKSTDQSVLTAPRSLSQLITSFIGSQCQGIRPALLLALPFASCFWVLFELLNSQYFVVFIPNKNFYCLYTRSILICITFALFCFQVSFCSWEQISVILFQITQIHFQDLVGTNGLEPSTSRLSGVRSNHLSYAPVFKFLQNWTIQI